MAKALINSCQVTGGRQSVEHFEQQYWVRKSDDILKEDFNYLWVLPSLFVFDDWKDISTFLEDLFANKAITKVTFPKVSL